MMVTVPAASLPNGSDVKLQIINTWAAGDYYFYVDNFVVMQAAVDPPNCDATLTDITYSGDISWTAATGIPTGYTITAGTTSGDNDLADKNTMIQDLAKERLKNSVEDRRAHVSRIL